MRHSFPLALGAVIVASTLGLAAQAELSTGTENTTTGNTAEDTTAAESKTAMNPDSHFVMEAAEGSMAETEYGKLAADKASNAKVKEFGQRMVTDHGKAGDELKTLAASKHITLPTAINPKAKATKDRLSKLRRGVQSRQHGRHGEGSPRWTQWRFTRKPTAATTQRSRPGRARPPVWSTNISRWRATSRGSPPSRRTTRHHQIRRNS